MPCEHGTDSSEVCMACPPSTVVALTYFQPSGKWYARAAYVSHQDSWHKIIDEIRDLRGRRALPGLLPGHSPFIVLVEVGENRHFNIWSVEHLLL